MSLSLYDVSIPAFVRGFANLSAILEKGRAYADEQGIAHEELLQARLIATWRRSPRRSSGAAIPPRAWR